MRPWANDLHIVHSIFNFITFKENNHILIKITLKFIKKDETDDKAALIQIMVWRQATAWPNDNPFH